MAPNGRHVFTSESVTEGHPDKIADQISDAVLDAVLAEDTNGRVACETLVTTGLAFIAGEITTETYVDFPAIRPDGKSQVSIEYEGSSPKRIEAVVISCQHSETVSTDDLRDVVREQIINATLPGNMIDDGTKIHINPTGRFVIGGPQGDCGLTGRKIIVDTYGGVGSHGGGAFSGKDPSKVDRSASYMARHVAKNIVASGLAHRAEVQLAYAIGVVDPVSVMVDTFDTGEVPDDRLTAAVREVFPLSPLGIIEYLDLLRPIYKKTAAFGHFGRDEPEFTWERTDWTSDLRTACGV
jgi:S-adenosylmethionine synthetase